ncbi:BQ5605_C002g01579 [Microbotryum silenes-dioicae]|uniref:BQ5605_C002g01579 protein n=1 Tax=Microbotryum silenes-dioicae TaxID=796604 RepID=A0A2X0P251_9BASI|nr:BQ5605_C002g01579 [Microbotryum silenes-dioicae]
MEVIRVDMNWLCVTRLDPALPVCGLALVLSVVRCKTPFSSRTRRAASVAIGVLAEGNSVAVPVFAIRVGDACAVMCSIQGRAWKSKATGKYSGRIDFVPLRIRDNGTLNASGSVNCSSPSGGSSQVKLATPVKRSTLDACLDDGLNPSSGSHRTKK